MERKYTVKTIEELDKLSAEIIRNLGDTKIILLEGDLGAGKTTLAKKLLPQLGVSEPISSPTFSIVNVYDGPIYHFDLYRIRSIEELEEIGFFEYLDSGHFCLIEWPEIIEDYLDMPYLQIILTINEDNSRNLVILEVGE